MISQSIKKFFNLNTHANANHDDNGRHHRGLNHSQRQKILSLTKISVMRVAHKRDDLQTSLPACCLHHTSHEVSLDLTRQSVRGKCNEIDDLSSDFSNWIASHEKFEDVHDLTLLISRILEGGRIKHSYKDAHSMIGISVYHIEALSHTCNRCKARQACWRTVGLLSLVRLSRFSSNRS